MKLDLMAVLLTFPAVATSGCDKKRNEASTTRTTGATTETTTGGMQARSIVSGTMSCARDERTRAEGDIRAADCPTGVDDEKLQSCLDAIAKQDCATLTTSLWTMNECTTATLCGPRP